MKQLVQQLYESMLEELQLCKRKKLLQMEEIECCFQVCCFQVCTRYWAQLRERLLCYEFTSVNKEREIF